MRLSSAGQHPCGPHAGIRDRDRRPCEGVLKAGTAQPAVSVRPASPECVKQHGGRGRASGGCAIIRFDVGRFVNPIFKPSNAALNLLLPSTARPKHFCFLITVAILWLGIPARACAATTLEDSARELAQKIAVAIDSNEAASVEMRNASSLEQGEFVRVEHAIEAELQGRGIRSQPDAGTHVVITFSENVDGLVWTAEILKVDSRRVVLLSVPRVSLDRSAPGGVKTVLHAEKFWEGPEQILDAVDITNVGANSFAILFPHGVRIYRSGSELVSDVRLPSAPTAARDPRGVVIQIGDVLVVQLEPDVCRIDIDTGMVRECHSTQEPARARDPMDQEVPIAPRPKWMGSQAAWVGMDCGKTDLFLATRTGDYTEPDSIRLFQKNVTSLDPASEDLNFPGPVTALHAQSKMAMAVVRNLKTGNYEAYRLSISCGQ
jgi:hypothetical protein